MDSLKIGFLQNDGTGGHQTAQDVRIHSPNPDDEEFRQVKKWLLSQCLCGLQDFLKSAFLLKNDQILTNFS